MCTEKQFVKIFDERVALALSESGFSYMQEKINDGQTVYVFEETEEFMAALCELSETGVLQGVVFVRDSILHF